MPNVCPICNNPLRQYGKDFYVCEVCETYFDKNENIVLTEQEWLQTATTEQLADKLTDFSFWLVPNLPKEDKREQVRKWIENWLKEIHE